MDVLTILNEKVFLGQEFLTWLWWLAEQEAPHRTGDDRVVEVMLGDHLVLGPAQGREGARITVRGHEASLAEAREGLKQGKLVESLRLGLIVDNEEFWLSLRAADLTISSLKLPPMQGGDDHEPGGLWLERIALVEMAIAALDDLLRSFLQARLPDDGRDFRQTLTAWMEEER